MTSGIYQHQVSRYPKFRVTPVQGNTSAMHQLYCCNRKIAKDMGERGGGKASVELKNDELAATLSCELIARRQRRWRIRDGETSHQGGK